MLIILQLVTNYWTNLKNVNLMVALEEKLDIYQEDDEQLSP